MQTNLGNLADTTIYVEEGNGMVIAGTDILDGIEILLRRTQRSAVQTVTVLVGAVKDGYGCQLIAGIVDAVGALEDIWATVTITSMMRRSS